MTTTEGVLDRSSRLQALTREYARYAGSAGGLASLGGGVLCLASYLAGALLPPSMALRIALILAPLLWLATRQYWARRYYQRFGHVLEQVSDAERRRRRVLTCLMALVVVAVGTPVVGELEPFGSQPWTLPTVAYLLTLLAMPPIAWLCSRSPLDLVVGIFLVCQAALAFRAQPYALWSSAAVFPLAALLVIHAGLRDHRRFRDIEAQIRRFAQSPGGIE